MTMFRVLRSLIPVFLVCTSSATAMADQGPRRSRSFRSVVGGYQVAYPDSWYILDRSLPTLLIISFPPAQRVHDVILPPGGAMISIVPAPSGIHDIEHWIARDQKPGMDRLSIADTTVRGSGSLLLTVTEVHLMFEMGGTAAESLDCYFPVGDSLFAGRLTYWHGDGRAPEYRQVLYRLLQSLNILPR